MARYPRLVIITGLSGAGKTVALRSLEDLGFFCVDNFPPALIPKFSELISQSTDSVRRIALVCDLRGGEFFAALFDSLKELENHQIDYHILYLEADDEVIVRRYKASRRRHPLSLDGRITDGIIKERDMLQTVRSRAHLLIDTSDMKSTELKDLLAERLSAVSPGEMTLHIVSFGFKYGLPIDADLVFDVRFLPNPFYVDALRKRTGQETDVFDYVMKWQATHEFLEHLTQMIDFLLPQYQKEGKPLLVIGIGCTGGRHRSVAIAESLKNHVEVKQKVTVVHRDIAKDSER
nr:RNase adapter RapZ [Bacilli bacterium]